MFIAVNSKKKEDLFLTPLSKDGKVLIFPSKSSLKHYLKDTYSDEKFTSEFDSGKLNLIKIPEGLKEEYLQSGLVVEEPEDE